MMSHVRPFITWAIVGVSALILVLSIAVAWPALIAKAQEPKRFQYKIVEVLPDTNTMQSILNEHGLNGWELVTVSMGNMTEPRLIFKR